MEFKTIIGLIATGLGWVISVIQACISKHKATTQKKKEEAKQKLHDLVDDRLIALMEEAERIFSTGEEKEEWVINKLGQKIHVDFFKYPNVLQYVKDKISQTCKDTKIDVNKNIVIEKRPEIEMEQKTYD